MITIEEVLEAHKPVPNRGVAFNCSCGWTGMPMTRDWNGHIAQAITDAGFGPPPSSLSSIGPDCRDANHHKCRGDAWDEAHDHITECQCSCHAKQQADPRIAAAVQAMSGRDLGRMDREYYQGHAAAAIAAADAVDPLRQPGHRVEIAGFSWTLQHPAECRPDLLDCPVTRAFIRLGVSDIPDGIHAVELTEDGSLFLPDEVTL
ncbi:hypothetical protein [Specibacter sp. NPDC078692]|uniref:hypothetical protein n=1 Tax=Specibacter sp. NPDC078692 TaxID=3155818 RepID=UPI00342C8E5B